MIIIFNDRSQKVVNIVSYKIIDTKLLEMLLMLHFLLTKIKFAFFYQSINYLNFGSDLAARSFLHVY